MKHGGPRPSSPTRMRWPDGQICARPRARGVQLVDSYRGVLLYQEFSGHLVMHLRLRVQGAQQDDPARTYSLAGAMMRAPEPPGGISQTTIASRAFITVGTRGQASPGGNASRAAGIAQTGRLDS